MAVSNVIATAYGPPWGGSEGSGRTSTGLKLPTGGPQPPVVAVDPTVIPLGSILKIWPNPSGDPNTSYIALDTGGAIKGNRIDFLLPDRRLQNLWGRRSVSVQVLGHIDPRSATDAFKSGAGGKGGFQSLLEAIPGVKLIEEIGHNIKEAGKVPGDIAHGFEAVGSAIGDAVSVLTDYHTYIRLGKILAGAGLVLAGLYLLSRSEGVI